MNSNDINDNLKRAGICLVSGGVQLFSSLIVVLRAYRNNEVLPPEEKFIFMKLIPTIAFIFIDTGITIIYDTVHEIKALGCELTFFHKNPDNYPLN